MSTATGSRTAVPQGLDARVLARILEEGWGPGAWHGPDLKAALQDVPAALAYWRPAPGRHNIAEIALHHAYCLRAARGQLSGADPGPFVLPGEDWFVLDDERPLTWQKVRGALEREQERLEGLVREITGGKAAAALSEAERFDLVLGITCHAVYHAGQVQLIKRLRSG